MEDLKQEQPSQEEIKQPHAFLQVKPVLVNKTQWDQIAKIRDAFSWFVSAVNDVEATAIKEGSTFVPVFKEDLDETGKQVTKAFMQKHGLLPQDPQPAAQTIESVTKTN